jgi:GTPase SAR1 family protein
MDGTRSPTPEPPQDLWSSILDSVSSSRSIPSKYIVLLGQPSTGKSTLAAALLQKPVLDQGKEDQKSDYALGYDFADVRDDAEEGVYLAFHCNAFTSLPRRYPSTTFSVHCSVYCIILYGLATTFPAPSHIFATYCCRSHAGLDKTLVIC